jgi:hypothetical protein
MKETFAEFCLRIDRTPRLRNEGQPHECHAVLPFPDSERIAAFNLSDYYVSASVSGPCLEFRPRESVPHYVNQINDMGVSRPLSRSIRVF